MDARILRPGAKTNCEQILSNQALNAQTAPLYWIQGPVDIRDFVWEGFQLLGEAVMWGRHAWGAEPEKVALQRRLLPRPLDLWWPVFLDADFRKRAALKMHAPPLLSLLSHSGYMERVEWLQEIRRMARLHRLPNSRVEDALRHPAATCKLAYRLLRLAAARGALHSQEVGLSLATLRCAATPLLRRRTCQICFRVAFPGLKRCQFHSRSKLLATDKANQAARTARIIAGQTGDLRKKSDRMARDSRREDVMAGVLFTSHLQAPLEWRADVLDALSVAPRTSEQLSRGFRSLTPVALLGELRRKVDPDYWPAKRWADRIDLIEAWFDAEHAAAPGGPPRGPRPSTLHRLGQLEDLLMNGHSVATAADRLGMQPANAYQLLHRYGLKV